MFPPPIVFNAFICYEDAIDNLSPFNKSILISFNYFMKNLPNSIR